MPKKMVDAIKESLDDLIAVDAEFRSDLDRMIAQGNKVGAVKKYRKKTGLPLKEAHNWVNNRLANKKPTFKEYADFVTSLGSKQTMKNFNSKLGTCGLGLAGEAGVIAVTIKMLLYHGMKWNDEIKQNLIKEAGDVLWYLVFFCRNVLEVELEDVMEGNMAKLKERYQTGKFTTKEFMKKERKKKS